MASFVASALTLAGLACLSTPAAAQDKGGDKVNQVIVYGDDPCPESSDGTITVCARLDESERYRIPEGLRHSDDPANQSWTDRVRSYETVGDFGALSCTPVGAGGDLGCTQKLIDAAYAEKRTGSSVRFKQLIEEERAKRLSKIDEEAAETQSRVEEIEKEYLERQRRAQEEQTPDEKDASEAPLPKPDDNQ
ncbi:hypothetical protein D6851_13865 [Altericroceibacterium spongiae]|uniref:DUF2799 domain-containing protein n=1 Tax=Altericroceibacterium spongiae TaxID=2320269 RepID=A0A420EEL2_9SPHN|nr:hypothetical protein D6851_13865 [Altericroceibacterium spongiae]